MKRQYLYVYTCRKPAGWGRHFGYSGVTNRPDLRAVQHRAKDWHDLVIKRHLIPLGRIPRFVALGLEWVLIKVTMPVYNVQHNRANPRRIGPVMARRQRRARDHGSRTLRLATVAWARISYAPVVAFAALAFYLWSR